MDKGIGHNTPGEICAANASRFDQEHYDQPLTEYLVGGWDQDPLVELLDFFAPAVEVDRRVTYKEFLNVEAFYADDNDDDVREIGQEFREAPRAQTTEVTRRVPNKGLTITLDDDEASERRIRREADRLRRRLLRNELRRAIALIDAAAVGTSYTWDNSEGKDPDMDIITSLNTAADTNGLRNNRVAYGETSWTKRLLAHRAQNSAGGFASAASSVSELAALLGVEGLSMSEARYKGASNLTKMIGNMVYAFYGESGISQDDPSHTKRFFSPTETGEVIRVFVHKKGPKTTELTVEHYSLPTLTFPIGIFKRTIN